MYFESNKVKIKKADYPLRRILHKIYGISIETMSQLTGISADKIKKDAMAGYLRYFADDPNIIFKDQFYQNYCKEHGNLSQLTKYGYPEPPRPANIYYGYYIKRLPENQTAKPTYRLIAPDGTIKDFEGECFEEAFEKAKSYAFQNQVFDDNISARLITTTSLTLDELYLFLSLLPNDRYHFTRKKLQTGITLIKSRKHNKRKNKVNSNQNGDL